MKVHNIFFIESFKHLKKNYSFWISSRIRNFSY